MLGALRTLTSGAALVGLLGGSAQSAFAQDQAGSRDVKLNQAAARELTINQIETSKYPRVDIFATVLEKGEPVNGLAATDFRIREDEVDQEPITVEPKASPLSVVLTLDTSGSMSKALGKAKSAAASFIDTLSAEDSPSVLNFSRAVTVVAAPGSSRVAAKGAIDTLVARGDTALFDALYASLENVKNREGRRAVVLLSDGVDDDGHGQVLSKHTVEEVIALAKESNVPVFTIGLGTELDEATLQRVATESGGKFFKAPDAEQLGALYQGLGKALTGQYHIHYDSNLPADGSPRVIQLAQGALRNSKNYVAPGSVKAKAAVAATPAPLAKSPGTSMTVEASITPEGAPLLPTGSLHTFTNPTAAAGAGPLKSVFVAFDIKSGEYFSLISSVARPNGAECPKYVMLTPALEPTFSQYGCNDISELRGSSLVTQERAGRWVVQLLNTSGGQIGIYTQPNFDGDSGRDAGSAEADAIELQPSISVVGHLMEDVDSSDRYTFQAKAGTEYQVRVRPDLNRSVEITLSNDEGVSIGKVHSQNNGAGVTMPFTPENDSVITIGVANYYPSDDGVGSYAVIVGPKGVAAPTQPSPATIAKPMLQSSQK